MEDPICDAADTIRDLKAQANRQADVAVLVGEIQRQRMVISVLRSALADVAHGKHSGRAFANRILSDTSQDDLPEAQPKTEPGPYENPRKPKPETP